jgi:hypothetical protein
MFHRLCCSLLVLAALCGRAASVHAQAACAPPWSAGQVYTAGNQASLNSTSYQANWWTLGEDPSSHNGGPGSGQPWTSFGGCSGGGGGGGTPIVQVFQDCNFGGWVANFTTTGSSSTADLVSRGGRDNDASAIKVAAGFKVTLFDGDQQTGASVVVTAGDTACFTAPNLNFNDRVSSLRIEVDNGGGGGGGGSARFAPYADISLGIGSQVAANASAAGLKAITLAFLVDGGCTAVWGGGLGNVANAMFPSGTSVKSAIDALVAQGVSVIVSWGGAAGSIQSSCGTASQVQAMYQSVFNAYPNIAGQDFDIEGGINNTVVAQALTGLKAANPSKSVSLTLPVLPTGLVTAGLGIVNACHAIGFHPDTINVMAMDMGSANDNGGNMLLSAQQAAQATATRPAT